MRWGAMRETPPHDAALSAANTPEGALADTQPRLPRVVAPQPAPSGAPRERAIAWRAIALRALVLWAATRFAYLAFTYFTVSLPFVRPAQGTGFFGPWQRFDTNWYLSIALGGYTQPQQIAFFPLYPALIRLFAFVPGVSGLGAALIVSNLATLAALVGMGALVAWETRDLGERGGDEAGGAGGAPTRAMVYLLAFPFAFFLTAAYTEGVFIASVAFLLLFARQGRWGLATLFALAAGATRPTGVAVILPLAWEWARQYGLLDPTIWRAALARRRVDALRPLVGRVLVAARRGWLGLLSVCAVPACFLLFMVYAGLRFGHPLLVINAHRDYWGTVSAPPWTAMAREVGNLVAAPAASPQQVIMLLDVMTIAVVAALIATLWRSLPVMFNLYMLSLLYVAIGEPTAKGLQVLQGPARYLLPSLPLFLALSVKLERRPALAQALIALGFLLQAYIALRFLTGVLVE